MPLYGGITAAMISSHTETITITLILSYQRYRRGFVEDPSIFYYLEKQGLWHDVEEPLKPVLSQLNVGHSSILWSRLF